MQTPIYQTLTFRQTGELLKALGGGTAGFDYKRVALADLRRFIATWIAQGSFTLEHVEALAASVSAPPTMPVPAAPVPPAPAPLPAPAPTVAAPPAPIAPPAPAAPIAPQPFGAVLPIVTAYRFPLESPSVAPVVVPAIVPPAPQPIAPPLPPLPAAAVPAAVATVVDVAPPAPSVVPSVVVPTPAALPAPHVNGAPYRLLQARAVFADQPDVAATLPENLLLKHYDSPDAPTIDPLYQFPPSVVLKTLLAMTCARPMPVWCVGPKGTGKTEYCQQLAARLGRVFFRVAFNRSTEPAEILGDMGLVDGATVWNDGPVSQALRTPGAVLLLDEITYAAQGYLAALNPVLECRGAPVRLPRTGERLIPADDVFTLAADNTSGHGDTTGEYPNRGVMAADTRDRFRVTLQFAYLPPDVEKRVLVAHVARECGRKVRSGAAAAIVKLMQVARDRGAAGELQGAPSLRAAVAMAVLISGGVAAPDAFDDTVTRAAPPESHEALRQIFAAHWPSNDPDVAAFFN